MQTEKQLLEKLKQQIIKIEKFVLDLQQDYRWQRIFYRKKLYLGLNIVFKKNYTEYSKYLEDILADYKLLLKAKDNTLKEYYVLRLESKVFALLKIIRNLKKYTHKTSNDNNIENILAHKQQQNFKLTQQRESLEQMLKYLDNQYQALNKQISYGKQNVDKQTTLQENAIKILAKKGKLEQELFSIKERLSLNS